MKASLPLLFLLFSFVTRAQTADSVRTELTTEPAATIQPADTSERGRTERSLLKKLFMSSRKETTMFQLGIIDPDQIGFIGNRTLNNRYGYGGFWLGINHKLTSSFGLRGGVLWNSALWFLSSREYKMQGANLMGLAAIDYYPFIQKRIRNGKTANNFFNNPFVTLETWRPFSNATITEQATGTRYNVVPFRQTLGLGVGVVSLRTKVIFYTASLKAAYFFDRPADVKHAVQPMLSFSTGFGF